MHGSPAVCECMHRHICAYGGLGSSKGSGKMDVVKGAGPGRWRGWDLPSRSPHGTCVGGNECTDVGPLMGSRVALS